MSRMLDCCIICMSLGPRAFTYRLTVPRKMNTYVFNSLSRRQLRSVPEQREQRIHRDMEWPQIFEKDLYFHNIQNVRIRMKRFDERLICIRLATTKTPLPVDLHHSERGVHECSEAGVTPDMGPC